MNARVPEAFGPVGKLLKDRLPLRSPVIYCVFYQPMPDYHTHEWRVRREWKDADGRLLRHRTCRGCTLEQQICFVYSDMTWTLFRQWDRSSSVALGLRPQ